MKKIFLLLSVLFFTAPVTVYPQQAFEYEYPFSLLFKNSVRINPYYIGNNPAYLFLDREDEVLTIHSLYSAANGDYKMFVEPGQINSYQLGAFGKKSIGDRQIFKGSFGFQRTEYNNWQWIFTKDYASGNPFLIGNTTTGNTRFNGIIMSAEYCNKISAGLQLGASLKYYVDEGLKEITPKPTSKHREIDFKLGAGYNLSDKLSAGIVLNVFDRYENIIFSQDEEDINREVTIIKFRGFDFPYTISKKDETRNAYNNGYLGDITFAYGLNDIVSFSAFAGGGFQKTMTKDDAIDPLPDGFWKNDIFRTGLYAVSSAIENLTLGISFSLSINNMWSSNPSYQSVYMENKYSVNSTLLGAEYSLNRNIKLGIEAGTELIKRNEDDYYSQVFSNSDLQRLSTRLGLEVNWSESLSTLLAYGFSNQSVGESELAYNVPTYYFINNRIYDLLYYQTDYNKHTITLNAELKTLTPGTFKFYFNYSFIKANKFAGDNMRKTMQAGIEYCIKAY